MPSSRRPPAPAETSSASRIWLVVSSLVVVTGLAGAVYFLWPREDKLAAVTEIQKQLLAAGGTPSRVAIDSMIRTVDRMDRRDVWNAYRAAGAEWKRIKQQAIDAYFVAPQTDRPQLLDEHIERIVAYHKLLSALNTSDRPGAPAYLPRERRRRRPEGEVAPEPSPAEAEAEKNRRDLAERFDEAIEARSKSRGITMPDFR